MGTAKRVCSDPKSVSYGFFVECRLIFLIFGRNTDLEFVVHGHFVRGRSGLVGSSSEAGWLSSVVSKICAGTKECDA